MIQPGEIHLADIPPGQQHGVLMVSREELNRGKYVVPAHIPFPKIRHPIGAGQLCAFESEPEEEWIYRQFQLFLDD